MNGAADLPSWTRVVVTKVRPPKRRRDLVSRERLHRAIAANLDRKLLLVSAPAGYGKTSLLVDYAHSAGITVCWYRLDPADRDPVTFFEHLVESLRQRFPGVCAETIAILRQRAGSGTWMAADVVGSLVNEIDACIDGFFWLVLDDYQHIDDAARVNEAIDALLHYLPDNCQIVISGRTVPRKLTLTRLAGAGQAIGIGQEQLRFTVDEIRDLIATVHGRRPTEAECDRLARESEGWVTALVLGGRQLLDGGRTMVKDRDELFEYLAHEVFAGQPESVRDFMVRTAALEDLSPDLCDAALQRTDSASMLDALETQHLFVSRIDGEERWHRYHQLFRDFLRKRMEHDIDLDERRSLHRRAADWMDAAGRADEAVAHKVKAGDFDIAAARMADLSEAAYESGRWQTIVRWAETLPHDVLRARPLLVQRLGTALAYSGDLPRALEVYGWAVADAEAARDDEALASTLVRRSVLFRLLGKAAEALLDARRAVCLAPDPRGVTAGLAHRAMGGVLYMQADMIGAERELRSALDCFEPLGESALIANAHNDLSATYQWSGDVDRAVHHSREAIGRWERLGNLPAMAVCANNLGTALHQQGRFDDARIWLERAIESSDRSGYRRAAATARISMGDLLCDLDQAAGALEHYDRGIDLAETVLDSSVQCCAYASRAEAHRHLGDLESARRDLAAARDALARTESAVDRAWVDHVSGTIALSDGDPATALRHLGAAADGFASSGAHRDAARSLLCAAAAAGALGQPEPAWPWRARAEEAVARLPYPKALDPLRRRLARGDLTAAARGARSARDSAHQAPGPMSTAGMLEVCALGPPQVRLDGLALGQRAWQSTSAHEIFFLLMAHSEGLTSERLMATLWPDAPDERSRSALHTSVHRIRRALGRKEAVAWDSVRYKIAWPGAIVYDVAEFRLLTTTAAAAADDRERAAALQRATDLARGEYLEGSLADWCEPFRRELEVAVIEALVALGDAYARLAAHAPAIGAYRRALATEPLREDAHRGLMRAYAASGDRAMALRQYAACARLLADELGAAPDVETIALHRRLVG